MRLPGWRRPASGTPGERAEAWAARYLQRQGLEVEARNYRCRGGEIDLVVRDGETLVFVEVRLSRWFRLPGRQYRSPQAEQAGARCRALPGLHPRGFPPAVSIRCPGTVWPCRSRRRVSRRMAARRLSAGGLTRRERCGFDPASGNNPAGCHVKLPPGGYTASLLSGSPPGAGKDGRRSRAARATALRWHRISDTSIFRARVPIA